MLARQSIAHQPCHDIDRYPVLLRRSSVPIHPQLSIRPEPDPQITAIAGAVCKPVRAQHLQSNRLARRQDADRRAWVCSQPFCRPAQQSALRLTCCPTKTFSLSKRFAYFPIVRPSRQTKLLCSATRIMMANRRFVKFS